MPSDKVEVAITACLSAERYMDVYSSFLFKANHDIKFTR